MNPKFLISNAWLKQCLHRILPAIAVCSMVWAEAAQAAPGDLVITEIQSDGAVDFWELTNVSASSIDLSNYKWTDNARSATGAIAIPLGTSIAAGESVIFTGQAAATYRTFWGIASTVQVITGTGVPGLGSADAITLYDASNTEVCYLSYAANGFTRSNGSAAAGGHAGISAGGATAQALIWDSSFGTTTPRYTFADGTTKGTFAGTTTTNKGSPGYSGFGASAPAVVLSVIVTPSTFSESASNPAGAGTVTRTGATTSALVVNLSSSDVTEATVPASVTIPIGSASASFDVTAVNDSFPDGNKTSTITASAADATAGTTVVTVNDDGDVYVQTLMLTEVLSQQAAVGVSDFWELTNISAVTKDISGYSWHDNARSGAAAAAYKLPSGSSIAAGESVIFTTMTPAAFRSWWGIANSVQVFQTVGAPGLGQNDGVSFFDSEGNELFFFNYALAGFTKADGSSSTGGHSGPSAGASTETQSAMWVPASGTTTPRYTFATVNYEGAFASAASALDIGSPGISVGPPTVNIGSATLNEGNSGTSTLSLVVTRSDTATAFTIDYAVTGGTATSGTDFATLASGTLTFAAAGSATQNIDITVNGDTASEPDETIILTLSNVVNTTGATVIQNATGTGTLTNDDIVPASIATHPVGSTIATGYTATLSVSTAGFPVPTMQWYQGNSGDTSTPVGTNSSNFTTPALTTTTSYWVRASNSGGTADSNAATVTVTTGPTSVNLANYVRIGRHNLPEPTRTALPLGTPVHNFLCQEASAVTYNWDTDTLFITGDGGRAITQVSKTGQLIDTMTLALGSSPQGTDFYDPEGLTYIGGGQFVMSEERDRQLVKFTYAAGTTLSRSGAQTVKIGTFVDNTGTEGLSWDPQTGGFICLKELTPIGIFQTGVDFAAGTATNGSPTTVNSTNLFDPALLGMTDTADIFALSNLSSTNGQPQAGNLIVLGQEDARIVNVDRSGVITSTLNISGDPGNPLTPAGQQHEGVTMDRAGILYVVNENGGGSIDYPQLWVYAPATQPNAAPTAVVVDNATTTLPENSSTASRVKLGDIIVTDDGLGTNTLSLSGADAASFELTGTEFYLKAGVALDFETKTSYAVTVNAEDATVGSTPDVSVNFTLTVGNVEPEAPPAPVIIISEVAPWASSNSAVLADWFEITNVTSNTINIAGWKIDDNSAIFGSAATLNGVTTLAAGESAIFIETTDLPAKDTLFRSTWALAASPTGPQIGSYTGSGGLGSGGDAVNIYNAAGVLMASVTFGASDAVSPFQTFDNTRGLNATTISHLSLVGTHGAIASSDAAEVGSPGFAAPGVLRITEVAAWGSGNGNYLADWFEVTNTGARAVDITGWKIDDSSESPAAALSLTGITSIAPGESVIFLETATPLTTLATFRSTWFSTTPPPALQVGSYTGTGAGLSTGGDAVVLYDGNNVRQAKVFFAGSPLATPFATFDNSVGADNVSLATLSVVGTNGAFVALTDADEIGSPGIRNQPPVLASSLPSQSATKGAAFSYVVPLNTFADPESQPLTYSATLSDNSPLPAWLSFTAGTRTLAGTPTAVDLGNVVVKVSATDGGLASSTTLIIQVAPAFGSAYFPQSVASGDPRSSSVILWTRLMDGETAVNRTVTLHMSTTGTLANVGTTAALGGTNVWTGGALTAQSAHDGVVKAKVTGLSADTTYYYQFSYNGQRSPIGRTKTAPAAGSTRTVKYAAINCNDFVGRYFNVLRQLAEREQNSIDFVLNLGDYVYETTGDPSFQTSSPERAMVFSNPAEAINLGSGNYAAQSVGNYRDVYKTIRQDAQLQRVHELFPMISIWDDHEFSDDNWKDNATYFDGKVNEQQTSRKRNGEQAWMEFLPTERGIAATGAGLEIDSTDLYPNTVIYDAFNFGTNLDLILTDIRTNRADHLIPEDAIPSGIPMTEANVIATLAAANGLDVPTFTAAVWPSIRSNFAQYVNIDDSAYAAVKGVYKAIMAASANTALAALPAGQTAITTGAAYADAQVVGLQDANFINQAFVAAGQTAPFDAAALAAMPRGLSYYLLGKTSVFSDFGSRYQVVNQTFQLFAGYTYQAFIASSGAIGRDQAFYNSAQQTFLATALANSTAAGNKWRVVASSTPYTPIKLELGDLPTGVTLPNQGTIGALTIPASLPAQFLVEFLLNADEPAGFPQFRQGMIDLFAQHDAIIVSGDIHAELIGRNNATNGQKVVDFTVPSAASSEFRGAVSGAFSTVEALMTPSVQQATGQTGPFAFDATQKQAVINATDAIIKHNTPEMFQADTAAHGYTVFTAGPSAFNADYQKINVSEIDDNLYALSPSALNAKFSTQSFAVSKTGAGASTDLAISEVDYTLQVLHYYGESGLLGIQTAPIMGAMIDRFDDQYANTVVIGEGDSFIPGPWLVAGADPAFNSLLHTTAQVYSGNNGALGVAGTFNATATATTAVPFARADIAIMNAFGTTVSALGNHEFDLGSPVLASAIYPATTTGTSAVGNWVGAKFPHITANLDFSADSSLRGRADISLGGVAGAANNAPNVNAITAGTIANLEVTSVNMQAKIAPYAIKTINGQRIGFVGATTFDLLSKSSPNGTVPKDDANAATSDLQEVAAYLQGAVNSLQALGVTKIIQVDQLDTLQRNKDLAPLVSGIDIVIAGGGHERMGDATDTAVGFNGHDADFIADAYPIVATGADGRPVLIVTTDTEYTYLGRLVADFDADGTLIVPNLNPVINGAYASTEANLQAAYATANSAASIIASSTMGSQVKTIVDAINTVVVAKDSNVYGYTNVYLEGDRVFGRTQEVNLGNITADANAWKARSALSLGLGDAVFSLKNGGGIRASLGSVLAGGTKVPPVANVITGKPAKGISQLDIENALRFDNKLMVFDVTPQGLLNILNYAAGLSSGPTVQSGGYAQVGNIRFSYNTTALPNGSRVRSAALVNEAGQITARIVENGVVLAGAPSTIKCVALSFTANGGDNYPIKYLNPPTNTTVNTETSNFRLLLTNGGLSDPIARNLDFTAASTYTSLGITAADVLGEQKAFQDFLAARHPNLATAYNIADTSVAQDTRVQQLAVRTDTVLSGPATFAAWLAQNGFSGSAGGDTDNDGIPDSLEYFFNASPNGGADRDNLPTVVLNGGDLEFRFTYLNSTIFPAYLQCSEDLVNWVNATAGVDYEVITETVNGAETSVRFRIFSSPVPTQQGPFTYLAPFTADVDRGVIDKLTITNHGMVGAGRLSGDSYDSFGETMGAASGLSITDWSYNSVTGQFNGTFNVLPDRGYNSGTIFSNYAARVHQTPFTFTPYYGAGPVAQTQIVPAYASTTKFTYLDGATTKFTTGLNATAVTSIMGQIVGTTAAANGPGGATENLISFDAEAIHVFPDGSGFVSDEYGTYIARFNSAKQFTRIIQLPLAAQPHRPADTLNFDSATAPTNGRRNNQGLEGMAVSPNNSRLFALMQSALVQDGGAAQTRFNTRLFVYDIAGANLENPVLIGEYVVQLPRYDLNGNSSGLDATAAQSEIVALSNTQLLMLPRDGNGLGKGTTDPIVTKTVDLVDFSTATNVLGLYDARGNQISPTGALRVGITPARSTVVVNLLSSADLGKFGFNTNTASPNSFTVNEKAEGMALVPDTSTASSEDYFLFVANDNDFQSSDVRMVDATGNLVSYGDARDRGIVNDAVFTAWRITITPNNRKFFRLDLDTTP
ncbi:MAG: lamin tail domain-containing protein [Verrucomicrobia bacterium]|nr:lamin tail domain-containing protein [Verrucomicrobiota bacterium]